MARQLVIELVGKADKFSKSLDEAGKKTSSFGDKVGAAGTKMTKFVSVPIIGFLGVAAKAGAEEAAQMDNLAKTLGNTTGATEKQVKAVETQIGVWQKASNFSDGELRPAFENLARATGDVEEASKLMSTAMDIAAATGRPVEQVAEAMMKAHQGNIGALSRLGIETKDAEGKTLSFEETMKNANSTFGGQAQAASETTAGKMNQLKMTMADLTEDIGKKLIPILEKMIGWFSSAFGAIEKLGPAADVVLVALLAFAAAGPILKAVDLATKAWAASQWLLNAAMSANPLGLVLVAVGLLTAGLVLAYQKSETFRDIVDGAFRTVAGTVDWVITKFGEMVSVIAGLPGRITSATTGMWDGIRDAFKSAMNWIIERWNRLEFGMPGFEAFGQTIGGFTVGVPDIPRLAAGGPVAGGNPYFVGEHGPELFIPGGSGTIVPHGAGGGSTTVVLQLDGREVTRVVVNQLNREQRTSGVMTRLAS